MAELRSQSGWFEMRWSESLCKISWMEIPVRCAGAFIPGFEEPGCKLAESTRNPRKVPSAWDAL